MQHFTTRWLDSRWLSLVGANLIGGKTTATQERKSPISRLHLKRDPVKLLQTLLAFRLDTNDVCLTRFNGNPG